jgi:hypothetical protein
MNQNVTWTGSLERYHPCPQPQKVSKIRKIYCTYSTLPKTAKSRFGWLGPLGVKLEYLPTKKRQIWFTLTIEAFNGFLFEVCLHFFSKMLFFIQYLFRYYESSFYYVFKFEIILS